MLRAFWRKSQPSPEQERRLHQVLVAVFLATGAFLMSDTGFFWLRSVPVKAEVTGVERVVDHEGDVTWRPSFKIQVDGRDIEYTGKASFHPKPHQPGDMVAARFNPSSGVIRSSKTDSTRLLLGFVSLLAAGKSAYVLFRLSRF